MERPRAAALLSLLPALLIGCAVKQPPETAKILDQALPETTSIPSDWTGAEEVDSGEIDDAWIRSFGDPRLEALVGEAIRNSPNLRAAAAQVERAAAMARLAGSQLKPAIAFAGQVAQLGGNPAVSGTDWSGGLSMSWEADVWGRVRAGARAGEEALAASQADFAFARQSLAAGIAKAWFLAAETRALLELSEESVRLFGEIRELVGAKHEVGQVSMQEVHLAQADVDGAKEALRQAQAAHQQVRRGLEVLLGRYPAAEIETAAEQPPVPPPTPVGIPAAIVERRPDLLAAERRVRAAFLLGEQARLARLPSITLSASTGVNSQLSDLIGSLGAGLVAPLFTGGALEAQLEAASADQKAAVAAYGQAVLTAFREVEDALNNERLFVDRETYLQSVVQNNQKAVEMARARFDEGQIDLLSVIQIQARVIAARASLIRIRGERLAQRVNLHLALGGSFESEPSQRE